MNRVSLRPPRWRGACFPRRPPLARRPPGCSLHRSESPPGAAPIAPRAPRVHPPSLRDPPGAPLIAPRPLQVLPPSLREPLGAAPIAPRVPRCSPHHRLHPCSHRLAPGGSPGCAPEQLRFSTPPQWGADPERGSQLHLLSKTARKKKPKSHSLGENKKPCRRSTLALRHGAGARWRCHTTNLRSEHNPHAPGLPRCPQPCEGTPPQRPPELRDSLHGVPTSPPARCSRSPCARASPLSPSKPRGYFWPPVFSESAPVTALHRTLFLALPEGRGTRWAQAAGSGHGLVSGPSAPAARAPQPPGLPRTRRGGRGARRTAATGTGPPARGKGLGPAPAFTAPTRAHRPRTGAAGEKRRSRGAAGKAVPPTATPPLGDR